MNEREARRLLLEWRGRAKRAPTAVAMTLVDRTLGRMENGPGRPDAETIRKACHYYSKPAAPILRAFGRPVLPGDEKVTASSSSRRHLDDPSVPDLIEALSEVGAMIDQVLDYLRRQDRPPARPARPPRGQAAREGKR